MNKLRKHDHTLDGSDWDLSSLSLTESPVEELKRNPLAKNIDLSNNMLITLAPSFTSLTHLVVLDLSKNGLTQLPLDFGNLVKLNRLDLYSNQLKSLPNSFGLLTKLKWLDLKHNPLEATLMKAAGDCHNTRQCQLCASNVVQFMQRETIRSEDEMRLNYYLNEKLKQEQRVLSEKNEREKWKKRAKNARRSARKVGREERVSDSVPEKDSVSDSKTKQIDVRAMSSTTLFSYLSRILLYIILISVLTFSWFGSIAIAVHLQKGAKLESLSDVKIALISSYSKLKDCRQLFSDITILFRSFINDWNKTFDFNFIKQLTNKTDL